MKYTIKYLRQNGYKVRVLHSRNYHEFDRIDGKCKEVKAKGGTTTIEVTTPDKKQTVFGTAICSEEDNFNRRVGNEIALGRAIGSLEILKKYE